MEVSRSAKIGTVIIIIGGIIALFSVIWQLITTFLILDPKLIVIGITLMVTGFPILFYGLPTNGRVTMLCIIGISFIVLSYILCAFLITRIDVMITCCVLYTLFFVCAFIVPAGYLIGLDRGTDHMKLLIHVDMAFALAIPLGFLFTLIGNLAASANGSAVPFLDYFLASYFGMFGLGLVFSLLIMAATAYKI